MFDIIQGKGVITVIGSHVSSVWYGIVEFNVPLDTV